MGVTVLHLNDSGHSSAVRISKKKNVCFLNRTFHWIQIESFDCYWSIIYSAECEGLGSKAKGSYGEIRTCFGHLAFILIHFMLIGFLIPHAGNNSLI